MHSLVLHDRLLCAAHWFSVSHNPLSFRPLYSKKVCLYVLPSLYCVHTLLNITDLDVLVGPIFDSDRMKKGHR
jgi:hypothetical protein